MVKRMLVCRLSPIKFEPEIATNIINNSKSIKKIIMFSKKLLKKTTSKSNEKKPIEMNKSITEKILSTTP